MSRAIHFGVASYAAAEIPAAGVRDRLAAHLAAEGGLAAGFEVQGSFTAWGEDFPYCEWDAVHVTHRTECADFDEDGDPIRLSADEVREVVDELSEHLPWFLRVVDYWLEDDGEEWGSDVHLHGPWALTSVSGRRLAGEVAVNG